MSMQYKNWDSKTTMAVCHVPKAMGSWLRKELLNALGPERMFKPVATFVGQEVDINVLSQVRQNGTQNYSLIEGHFPMSPDHIEAFRDCYWIACVRNPIDLLRSHLNYVALQMDFSSNHTATDAKHQSGSINSMHFNEYYQKYKYVFDNVLTRYLSGISPERLLTEAEAKDATKKAIHNIDKVLDFIFVDKYLDQCCNFFYELTNIRISSGTPVNTSTPVNWCFTKSVFAEIAEDVFFDLYKHDNLVYQHAMKKFIQAAALRARDTIGGI